MTRLLLAIDLYDVQPGLLEHAAEWAARMGARIDLIFTGPYAETARFVLDPQVRHMLEDVAVANRRTDRARLDDLLATLPEPVRGEAVLGDGNPVDELLDAERRYDAVMLGTHGHKGLARALLGSVAAQVLRRAHGTVIILRP